MRGTKLKNRERSDPVCIASKGRKQANIKKQSNFRKGQKSLATLTIFQSRVCTNGIKEDADRNYCCYHLSFCFLSDCSLGR